MFNCSCAHACKNRFIIIYTNYIYVIYIYLYIYNGCARVRVFVRARITFNAAARVIDQNETGVPVAVIHGSTNLLQ